MTLLGTLGMLGLGTLLIGELPRRDRRRGLVSAALLTSATASLVLGLIATVVSPYVSSRFGNITRTPGQAAVFAAGVMLTGATLVFDQATIGLLRGSLQLSRNLMLSLLKLLILPVTAVTLHDEFGAGITLSTVAGTGLSILSVAFWLHHTGGPVLPRPDWGVLRRLGRVTLAHNWLNLSIAIPRSLIPVLVTVIVSPTANAAFYTAWMLSGFLYVVPTHLATVLFAVAAADPQALAKKLRFTLRLSILIGLPGMAVLALGAAPVLHAFGKDYASEGLVPLLLLIAGYLPTIPKVHYVAVSRAAGRISRAAAVLTLTAVLEVAAAALGGVYGRLDGLTLALVAVFLLEGLVTLPPVLKAALGGGRHRRSVAPTGAGKRHPADVRERRSTVDRHPGRVVGSVGPADGRPPARAEGGARYRPRVVSEQDQLEAIAVLLSLAKSVGLNPPGPVPYSDDGLDAQRQAAVPAHRRSRP